MTKSIMKREDCAKFIPVRLADAKKKQLAKLAIDSNTSMNALINAAIDDFLKSKAKLTSSPP